MTAFRMFDRGDERHNVPITNEVPKSFEGLIRVSRKERFTVGLRKVIEAFAALPAPRTLV